MREYGKFPIEHAARTEPSDGSGHSGAHVNVEARLRTVGGFEINDRPIGSAGQFQFLGLGAIAVPRSDDFLRLGFSLQPDRDGLCVSIFHRNAVALRAHRERSRNNFGAVQLTQKFPGFLLHFFFFIADVGNHVA